MSLLVSAACAHAAPKKRPPVASPSITRVPATTKQPVIAPVKRPAVAAPATAPVAAPADSTPLVVRPMPPLAQVSSYWYTRAERTDYRETSTYDQTVEYVRRLSAASRWLSVQSFGTSGQGRDLVMVVASNDRAFTPEAARATGKPIVLVQCGIHSGEIEGKDAMLALLRDIAVAGTQRNLLDHCTLIVIPILSVDAHERRSAYNRINQNGPEPTGWRTTPIGLNLNRDYLKAEAPEMRAFLGNVFTRWWPDLLIDTHTTDGVDCRYDVTYGFNHGPEDPAPVTRWLEQEFESRVMPAVDSLGHLTAPYLYMRSWWNPFSGFYFGDGEPRFSHGYPPIQCRPAILVETHMLKPYAVRVRATYDLVSGVLAEVNARPQALLQAIADAEAEVIGRGREPDPARRQVVLDSEASPESTMFLFQGDRVSWETSDIAGAPIPHYSRTPIDTLIPEFATLVPSLTVTQPVGYLVPQEWTSVVQRLDLHGVRYRRFARSWSDSVEQERIVEWRAATAPSEGHFPLTVSRIEMVRRERTWRPGDFWVPLDQRAGLVAVNLLEARAPDGLTRWNAFDTVLERKEYAEPYVMEPLARRMLRDDPALAREFQEKLRADSAFAASPFARLDFFYRRSLWADPEQNLLPVARALHAPPEDVLAK